jgi:3-oxoadipate enol-lactonase
MTSSWQEARAGDVIVRYIVSGHGPPLILLHGLSCSVGWWGRNIVPLSEHFRVYAVDLIRFRGPPPRPPFSLGEAARRMAAWMTAVGLDHAFVAGHSMGGHIAAELAADHPSLVDRLVLVAPAVLFPTAQPKLSLDHFVRTRRFVPFSLLPLLLQDALTLGPQFLWKASRALFVRDIRHKLATIHSPTLLVWGARDGIFSVIQAANVRTLLPDCELRIFPRAGHNPMWEEPHAFNDAILRFLTEG